MIEIPTVLHNKARSVGADRWLRQLPDLVADLAVDWELDIGHPLSGGTESYVTEARLADGTPAVLKLLVPRDGGRSQRAATEEATVLRLADGDGCARLYRHDDRRGALLTERLGPSLFDLGLPVDQRIELLGQAVQQIWRPAADAELRTGADKAAWLIDHVLTLWEELDRPCSERAVDEAVAFAERRAAAHDDERAVLVHGDAHQWNLLAAGDAGYKLIDPDGLLAEAEYDLGILMREDPVELLADGPRERSHRLASQHGLDETAIWEWGVVERVSTGLLAVKIDLQPVGDEMLAAAEQVVGR